MPKNIVIIHRPHHTEKLLPRLKLLLQSAFPAPDFQVTAYEVNINTLTDSLKGVSALQPSVVIGCVNNSTERLEEPIQYFYRISEIAKTKLICALTFDSIGDETDLSLLAKELPLPVSHGAHRHSCPTGGGIGIAPECVMIIDLSKPSLEAKQKVTINQVIQNNQPFSLTNFFKDLFTSQTPAAAAAQTGAVKETKPFSP